MDKPEYPQLTEPQLEIWLDNPATKAYLICIGLEMERVEGVLDGGRWIDQTNNDLTCWNLSNQRAKIEAYDNVRDPEALLRLKGMVEEAKKKPDEAPDQDSLPHVAPTLRTY